jgi:diadenylate cyclase
MIELFRDSPFYGMRGSDAVDVFILAVIIYRTFLLLRGTRAFQVLIGLLFLAGLYVVSERFELYTLRWLLDKFFVYIVLAVLILFQNDIRRALARAGGRFSRSFRGISETFAYEEVVRTAFALASRRIGALIVIERNASLGYLLDAGHELDARASQELLMALFHPSSPLHDGAVVLQKGRLAAAKVFLPLSLAKDSARSFGTRHRAALGLSEETDAVVVTVSEERGVVSLVLSGAITQVADTNELRELLQEIMQPRQESVTGATALGV